MHQVFERFWNAGGPSLRGEPSKAQCTEHLARYLRRTAGDTAISTQSFFVLFE